MRRQIAGLALAASVLVGIESVALAAVYNMPTGAMKPTLLVGDVFTAFPVNLDDLERGDVVVVRHPVEKSLHVFRLIGLPGDIVQLKGGVILLNETEVPQVPNGVFEEIFEPQGPTGAFPACENGPLTEGDLCTASRFTETLPPSKLYPDGRTFEVLNIETNGYADETESLVVPEGHFFVLGDNRDNSVDSRFSQSVGGMGFIPNQNIVGRVDQVLYSTSNAPGRTLLKIE